MRKSFISTRTSYHKTNGGKDMLLLTRRPGEQIRIGEDIIIKVLDVKGPQVRIGVVAPKTLEVHREEVYQRIQDEKKYNH